MTHQNKKKPRSNEADIVLVYPKTGIDLGATVSPPHSILAVAAPLKAKGYRVKIIDQRTDLNWRTTLIAAIEKQPICVGISCMTGTQIYFAIAVADVIRRHTDGKVPIVWGGPHPSILPEQTLQSEYVDAVCIGEGDLTFVELVNAYETHRSLEEIKGIAFRNGAATIVTPARPLLDVEELLPVPWELIDVEKYIHKDFYIREGTRSLDIGQTSRGCPFLCGFCCSASLRQRKWRAMSAEKSLDRILDTVEKFNLNSIWIRDDEFYINRKRANQIFEGIIKSGRKFKWYTSGTRIDIFNMASDDEIKLLKRSGADTLKFGAESGSDRILKLMNKGIHRQDTLNANHKARRNGIVPVFALMVGFPTETFSEIDQTIDLFVQLKSDNPQAQFEVIAPYTAFPGTPLYPLAIKHGLKPPQALTGWIDWLYDEYDVEGKKMPWFNADERKKIGNIAYMSILANGILNATGAVKSNMMRLMMMGLFKPISVFEKFKLKRKWYGFAPELNVASYLRKKVFYQSNRTIS